MKNCSNVSSKAFPCLLTLCTNGSALVLLSEVYGHQAHACSRQEHKQQDQALLQGCQTILGHVYLPSQVGTSTKRKDGSRTMWFILLYRTLCQRTPPSEL